MRWPLLIFFLSSFAFLMLFFSLRGRQDLSGDGRFVRAKVDETRYLQPDLPKLRRVASSHESNEPDFVLKIIDEIHSLNECYEKACEISGDEKTKYFSVGQKLKIKLEELAEFSRGHDVRSVELSALAREFLINSDGHVQEAALDILATQDIDQDNLEAILNHIIRSSDAELIHQAMLELKRYTYSADQRHIQEVFAETLLIGPPFVAVAIAEYLGDFLSEQSFIFYEDLVQKFDQRSIIHQYIMSALEQFEKRSAAG